LSDATLHYETVTAAEDRPDRWLLMLHGVYGWSRNWSQVAKRVVEARPEWGIALVDLREHGRSVGRRPGPHTLEATAADLNGVAEDLKGEAAAVLGHSFGGKVALQWLAMNERPASVQQAWIADSTPDAKEAGGTAWSMLELVTGLPTEFASREAAVEAMTGEGVPRPVAMWMAGNLELTGEGGYRWRLDWDAIESLLRSFYAADLWATAEQPPEGIDLHFIKAEGSDLLTEAACERIERAGQRTGRVHLHRAGGGHWMNIENPDAVVDLLRERL